MVTATSTRDPEAKLRLDGRVALVTGASRGIGKAIATTLARVGAQVALVSRKKEGLDRALAQITEVVPGARARCYVANAGDPDQAADAIRAVMADFGRIDVLVNNAATNPYYGPLVDIDVSRAAKTAQVNLLGPVLWTQGVWRSWMRDHGGVVVNTASLGAYVTEGGTGYYAATKAALVRLTTAFAAELAPGVRVNAIAPGLVKTDMARTLVEHRETELAAQVPLGRLGQPQDIADAALFLASDASSWLTGQTIVVDGGTLARPPSLLEETFQAARE